ncbi:hypothetical protein DI43_06195 [Geobacillus sp. CAMR12739]|nr:hypothetical protein DI43_06195 [Geobacillus sp. CAMR12739]
MDKNFAAGMSGGIAYVLADEDSWQQTANLELVSFERLEDEEEIRDVRRMIENHYRYTGSPRAALVLEEWDAYVRRFVKVIPRNYKLMMETIQTLEQSGLSHEEAVMVAFETVAKQKKAAVGGVHQLEAVAK